MKKLFIIIPILFLATGCASISENNKKFVFEDESYTLTLPTNYEYEPGAEYGVLNPKMVGNFPSIKLGLMATKENPSMEDILKDEETIRTNLCGQTNGCGKMTKWESVEIDGKTALKFTIQYRGRRIDEPNGYINEYHYFR